MAAPHRDNPFDLTGKVALVTGGNGGIGLAMAQGLCRAGARVVIAARARAKADVALAAIAGAGAEACFVPLQVTSQDSCEEAAAEAKRQFGRLDILVNNAGMNIRKRPEELSESEWREVLDVNLTGAFLCARAAYPHMRAQGGGKIINVGSMYSLFGAPLVAAYAASKGGLVQLTRSLAAAWASDKIQVNALLPGWIDTELTQVARSQIAGLEESVTERTPANRWGRPEDVAGAAVFLASAACHFITGTALSVDGGYSSRG